MILVKESWCGPPSGKAQGSLACTDSTCLNNDGYKDRFREVYKEVGINWHRSKKEKKIKALVIIYN